MRAITYSRFGDASEVLTLEELPTPQPASGEVLVRIAVSGVNPSDVKLRARGRAGTTVSPTAKIIPHSDGAGVIESVGAGVDPARIGERVWIWNAQWRRAQGTAADFIALPAEQAVALPSNVSFEQGAVLGIPGLTATHAVLADGPVEGQTLLVSGGAGTVGRLAVQVAKASGAKVLATARGSAGLAAARSAGADHVFDYSDTDLAAQILETIGGAHVNRIVEVEFGQNAETNATVIAEHGTIAAYGSEKDRTPVLPYFPLMFKAVRLDFVLVYLLSQDQRSRAVAAMTALLERDALDLRIAEIFDLKDCAQAHDLVATGTRAGSVLVKI